MVQGRGCGCGCLGVHVWVGQAAVQLLQPTLLVLVQHRLGCPVFLRAPIASSCREEAVVPCWATLLSTCTAKPQLPPAMPGVFLSSPSAFVQHTYRTVLSMYLSACMPSRE